MGGNNDKNLAFKYDWLMDEYSIEFDRLFNEEGEYMTVKGGWISKEGRGVYEINDFYISYEDMRACVDYGLSFEEFNKWYSYRMRLIGIDDTIKTPSLLEWISGCDLVPESEVNKMEETAKRLHDAEVEFSNALEDFRKNNKQMF